MRWIICMVVLITVCGCQNGESNEAKTFTMNLSASVEMKEINGVDEPPVYRNRIIARFKDEGLRRHLKSDEILCRYANPDTLSFTIRPYGGSALDVKAQPHILVAEETTSHASVLLRQDIEQRFELIVSSYLNDLSACEFLGVEPSK